jgi:hypothetical protein
VAVPLQTDRDHCPLRATNKRATYRSRQRETPEDQVKLYSLVVLASALFSLQLSSANADTFIVEGTFAEGFGLFHGTLSGTIDITAGSVTSADLVVSDLPSHFTNAAGANGELFVYDDPNIDARAANTEVPNGINELLLEFTPFPGPFLFGFLKANIIFGFARNEKTDPVTLVDTITYYDGGLTGTICPPGAALLSIPFLAPSPARDCRA